MLAKARLVCLGVTITSALSFLGLPRFPPGFLLALFLPQIAVAGEALRSFNIPADFAEKSLKVFAAQSGSEVLFATATGGAIRTNPLKGSYTPLEAMERLLQDTGLVAVRYEPDGPLTVTRVVDSKDSPDTHSTTTSFRERSSKKKPRKP